MLKNLGLPWKNKHEKEVIIDRSKFGYGGISITYEADADDISSIGTNFDVVNYRVKEPVEDLDEIAEIDEQCNSIYIDAAVGKDSHTNCFSTFLFSVK